MGVAQLALSVCRVKSGSRLEVPSVTTLTGEGHGGCQGLLEVTGLKCPKMQRELFKTNTNQNST